MTFETDFLALINALGNDKKSAELKVGVLSSLTTTTKTSIVNALNEVRALAVANGGGGGAVINDAGTSTSDIWSASKVTASIAAAQDSIKAELVGGAAAALDTFNELAAALGNDPTFAATLATQMSKRPRVDAAQSFTEPEKTQVRANIGAADAAGVALSKTKLDTLVTDLGVFQRDYVAVYNAAKA